MDIGRVIEECGMEVAIEEIIQLISKKIDEYLEDGSQERNNELMELLSDREKIYNNDKETIEKYIKL